MSIQQGSRVLTVAVVVVITFLSITSANETFVLDFSDDINAIVGNKVIEPQREKNVIHNREAQTLIMENQPKIAYLIGWYFPNESGTISVRFRGTKPVPEATSMIFAVYTDDDNRMYLRVVGGDEPRWQLYYRGQEVTRQVNVPLNADLSEWQQVTITWDEFNVTLSVEDVVMKSSQSGIVPPILLTEQTLLTLGSYAYGYSFSYGYAEFDYFRIRPIIEQ